ncbi:molybdate-anion transporter-like [Anneissia japonica]|uniref:molybdate-anion transporter-like n=1 Tax=Anneissia japonica TaxID=1529436 RepID=UPI001425B044|nr:molybdate-anion transporter-like [Anneissia japonica]XP_033111291.1 molybdate-anion transporter-like [Anneissia japonica]
MFIQIFIGLCVVCFLLYLFTRSVVPVSGDIAFRRFQWTYMAVYLLAMMADWMQGPYMYALYAKYEMTTSQIQQLFVGGFGASMLFGTFVGSVADKYGRRNNCILYCILYGLSCFTKHFANYNILMVGRLLGGIATSLLFSAFESWLVCEHKKRGFSDDLLSSVFTMATVGNSLVAILSGIVAQTFSDLYGMVAPFDVSLVILLILCMAIVTTWTENYGDSSGNLMSSFSAAITCIKDEPVMFYLGLVQSLFEGAMYTFVLEWTPALELSQATDPNNKALDKPLIPHGWIFASFMVAVMIGSSVFKLLNKVMVVESFMRFILLVAMVSLAVPIFVPMNQFAVFISFLVFEMCVGIFWPASGTMRSKYVPEKARATIMNLFRIPLNLLVIVILLQDLEMATIFKCCCLFLFSAFIAQSSLYRMVSSNFDSSLGKPIPVTEPDISYKDNNKEDIEKKDFYLKI